MAGGVKKPVNIFKIRSGNEPKEIFNWRLWFAVFSFGLLGAARGIDEGLITGAFGSKDFQKTINYDAYSTVEQANIKGNVSAMVQIGSVGGALLAFFVCDRIGRVWATRQLCVIWMVGIAMFMGNNGSLGLVYAGRFIAGLGVGQTPVVAPIYLAEIAPSSIRGLCTCVFTGNVYLGIVLAYFANYGAEVHLGDTTHNRWLVPTSLHIIFAGLILILSIFQYESPRYFVKKGDNDKAWEVMSKIRKLPADHEYVAQEIAGIQMAHQEELEATMGTGILGIAKELLLIKSNLYRLYLASMAQFMSQWSGAGSITLYAQDFFQMLGIEGNSESLLITGVFGIVKLVGALICALFLVDFIGRKRSLLIGICLQSITMIYVASFLSAFPRLETDPTYVLPDSKLWAGRLAIAMIYLSGFGWALGWNSMQYLLTAELFPLRIRAVATSISMTLHFANQYGNSRAVPNMLLEPSHGGISPKGTFWCFAAITILGGVWVLLQIPETAGRSLESMNNLFELPWYKIGLYGNKDAEELDVIRNEKRDDVQTEHVENVEHARDGTNRV